MEGVVYTSNFYIAIFLGVVALLIVGLLIYLVFFKKPKKNEFDPKDSPKQTKSPIKGKVNGPKKMISNPLVGRPIVPPFSSPVRRPMPGYNQSKK